MPPLQWPTIAPPRTDAAGSRPVQTVDICDFQVAGTMGNEGSVLRDGRETRIEFTFGVDIENLDLLPDRLLPNSVERTRIN
jgi:hypothetical protein